MSTFNQRSAIKKLLMISSRASSFLSGLGTVLNKKQVIGKYSGINIYTISKISRKQVSVNFDFSSFVNSALLGTLQFSCLIRLI